MKIIGGLLSFALLATSVFFALASVAFYGDPRSTSGFALIVAVLTFILGMFLARASSGKRCPKCAEKVKSAALKCRYCGYEFTSG